MLEENCISLAKYRMETSMETLNVARECLENKHFKDSINRAYYASFYAARAVLALERVDFKRHKDVIAYFNKNYVATGIFDREIGRNLARLKQKREQSDYDDFFIASKEEAQKQQWNHYLSKWFHCCFCIYNIIHNLYSIFIKVNPAVYDLNAIRS